MDKLLQIDDYIFEKFDCLALDSVRCALASVKVKSGNIPAPVYHSTPTPYKISTMTVLCDLRSRVDLDLLYANVEVFPQSNRILNVRLYGKPIRGLVRAKIVLKKPSDKKQMFLNQVTLDIGVGEAAIVSAKLFRDGKVQIAGCKQESDATVAMGVLQDSLTRCADKSCAGVFQLTLPDEVATRLTVAKDVDSDEVFRAKLQLEKYKKYKPRELRQFKEYEFAFIRRAVETSGPVLCANFLTVMINSDLDARAPLDKVKLVELLKSCGIHCRPSSSKYPGINAKYLTNVDCSKGCVTNLEKSRCAAASKKAKRPGGCGTVSILAFSQGKVIMTGARSVRQLNDTYAFVVKLFQEQYEKFGTSIA